MPEYDGKKYNSDEDALLAEIRDRFTYCQDQWQDVRDDGDEDMRYIAGDPWPAAERAQRKNLGRPCVATDELNQYINQLVNDIRQNKRAVKVVPRGYGANDKTAENRGDLIREIEYKSNAQSAYACGFENMCNRSYGGWKIVRRYVSEKSFDQELRIVRIPNPNSSYPDPDCKESDYSDARYWFLLDAIPRKEYKKKYPKATITDFDSTHYNIAPNWIKENQIQVAEYWKVEIKKRNLLLIKSPQHGVPPVSMYEDELPENADISEMRKDGQILNERESEQRSVMQYITNGVEILESNPEPGRYIPIVWLTGKELYVNDGGSPKRKLMSFIRLARDPQMLLNYYNTCIAEVVGMTPKVPYIGVVGQFHNPAEWQAANTNPKAFLEFNAKTEATGENILAAPSRQSYEPAIQALATGSEMARRAIQSALGLTSLPTNVQKLNDKSGVALKQIDANEDRGSFHFIDSYEMALEYSGRILNDKIPLVYDAAREVGMRNGKDEHRSVKINQEFKDEQGETQHIDMTSGEHEVTISTGPSFQSERDSANEFVDTMVPELEGLQLDATVKNKLVALLIKLKNVGPIGDEMVELLDPKDGPDQKDQQLQQLTQKSQQYEQMVAELQTENQTLLLEKKARIIENQSKEKIAALDRLVKLEVAEITTKAQNAGQRDALYAEIVGDQHDAAHEAALQAEDHAHDETMANKQAANQSDLAAQNAQHAQEAAAASPQNTGAGA